MKKLAHEVKEDFSRKKAHNIYDFAKGSENKSLTAFKETDPLQGSLILGSRPPSEAKGNLDLMMLKKDHYTSTKNLSQPLK